MVHQDNSINYVEFPMVDAQATKLFYSKVFGWSFTDWGDNYISFNGAGIDGGFDGSGDRPIAASGALVILYSKSLERCQDIIVGAGGTITRPIFSFPGGRRFHFNDTNGNELAVWSE
ncbi:MAG: VOC family protein [Cohaesibacteraceae bacterium]|nr:VOC family protein [Cohaesibacteraceae bacterium]MBL4876710.1 VOC family protein [Cohaesibacteraceae bacterium]